MASVRRSSLRAGKALSQWFQVGWQLFGSVDVRPVDRAPPLFRPLLESLEDRVQPAVLTVLNNADSGAGSLRQAIANAVSGDTIVFAPGALTITLSSTLTIDKNLTIIDTGIPDTTIAGGGSSSEFSVFTVNSGVTASLNGLTITNGHLTSGGGGILNNGTLTVVASTFTGNSAVSGGMSGNGGAISNSGTLMVTASTFTGNSADFGGAIINDGTLVVTGSTFTGNSATANFGGGIYNFGASTTTVTDSTFTGNSAFSGGGIYSNASPLTVTNSTFSGNSAFSGGGIYSTSNALTVTGSTFTGNSATAGGGGIYSFSGTSTVTNSTFSGNSASTGGGIFNNAGTLTVTASTLSGNSATSGGGILNNAGVVTLVNTIVANSTSGGDLVNLNIVSGHNNVIGDGSSLASFTDSISGDPLLSPLGDYGGPTQTFALLPGNPALGAAGAVDTLAADTTTTSTTITVNTPAIFAAGDLPTLLSGWYFTIRIGTELMAVTGKTGNTLTVVRGFNNTAAAAHTSGDNINLVSDQRGQIQTAATPDIGAFQTTPLVVTTDTDPGKQFAKLSLRETINLANVYAGAGQGNTITFAAPLDGATIRLGSGLVLSGQPGSGTATIAIDASALTGGVTIAGGGIPSNFSVFTVNSGVTASLTGLTITNGNSTSGGGVFNDGTLTVTNSTLTGNSAGDGGGIYNLGTLTVTGTTLSGNTANNGGGIFNTGGVFNIGILTVIGSTLTGNTADNTGGAIINGSTLTVTNSTLTGNSANFGGAITNSGMLTLTTSTLSGNTATYDGGAIDNSGTMAVTGSLLSKNTASDFGGAIDNSSAGTVTVTTSTLNKNTADFGGAIFNEGTMTVTTSTLNKNTAGSRGGGFNNNNKLTITNSTLAGNSAGDFGGAIYNESFDTVTVTDSTFSGNTADRLGGGIYNQATMTVIASTLSGNTAADGGGVYSDEAGTTTLVNTLVANSPTGGDLGGTAFSGNNNLIGDGSLLRSFTNSISGNPLLSPLGNYGGPTQTFALLPGSPALNAGASVSGLTADQRGRTHVGVPDIGAFESQGFTLTVISGSGQHATISSPFATPLVVTVTANDPLEPVAGGVIQFTAPSSGASAVLSGSAVTIAANGTASVAATANGTAGSYSVTAGGRRITGASFALTNDLAPPPPPLPKSPVVVSTAGLVQVTDPATGQAQTFIPFAGYLGDVRVAVGDVTGDKVADIIVGSGQASSHVKVFDGATLQEVRSFLTFPDFVGGVSVGVGDVTGDGIQDIVVGTATGSSHVKVFDGATGAEVRSFLAFPGFAGGVSVAAGDLDGDGATDLIVGAGPGSDPHVAAFSGRSGEVLLSFLAFAPGFVGGVSVGAGDLDGNGRAEVVVGAGPGAAPSVRVFDAAGSLLAGVEAFDPGFRGGVRVGVADVNGDGLPDVLVGAGPGAGPHVRAFAWPSLTLIESRMAFDPTLSGGVYVG